MGLAECTYGFLVVLLRKIGTNNVRLQLRISYPSRADTRLIPTPQLTMDPSAGKELRRVTQEQDAQFVVSSAHLMNVVPSNSHRALMGQAAAHLEGKPAKRGGAVSKKTKSTRLLETVRKKMTLAKEATHL